MTSEARAGLRAKDDAGPPVETAEQPQAEGVLDPVDEPGPAAEEPGADTGRGRRRRRSGRDEAPAGEPARAVRPGRGDDGEPSARRPSVPLVPALGILLVLLLAGTAFLWFTRPARSSVGSSDYVQALEAARSEVVDLTSFDYVTLDEDIARIKRVSTGDLRDESVAQLDKQRQQLAQAQAVVNTEVVGAGVTRANSSDATVLLVIQSTQKSAASPQAQVVRYRVEAQLKKIRGKWLLSGITGR